MHNCGTECWEVKYTWVPTLHVTITVLKTFVIVHLKVANSYMLEWAAWAFVFQLCTSICSFQCQKSPYLQSNSSTKKMVYLLPLDWSCCVKAKQSSLNNLFVLVVTCTKFKASNEQLLKKKFKIVHTKSSGPNDMWPKFAYVLNEFGSHNLYLGN